MDNEEVIQNSLLNGKSVVGLTLLQQPVDEELLYQNQTSVLNNTSSASGYDLASGSGQVINRVNNVAWEYHNVVLTRVPGYGFGIAVSGGSDNPHFANGDPAIAISDVLKGGPAQNKLQVNDRILSANNIKLENVDYATAVGVLRDSGPSVQLVIKRRCILDATSPESNLMQRTTLIKQTSKKKDLTSSDYGIVFGTKLYVKEILKKDLYENVQPGDYVLKINHINTLDLSIKDIKKIFNENKTESFNITTKKSNDENSFRRISEDDPSIQPRISSYPTQNLYVQPPTRNNLPPLPPLINGGDVEFPPDNVTHEESAIPPPPRPPLPMNHAYESNGQMTDYVSCRRELKYDSSDDLNYNYHRKKMLEQIQIDPPRYINFIKKDNSLGIRLTGGNRVGIFVAAVQPDSPAQDQGLKPADLIIKVNEIDYSETKPTREEAVLHLLSLSPNSPITLIVQTNQELFKKSQKTNQDEFYIRVNFDHDALKPTELNMRKGDIVKISDTLITGSVGEWEGYKLSKITQEITEKGILPNFQRAQEIYNEYLKKPQKDKFFRRKKKIYDNTVILSDAYTKVIYTKVDYTRPVVLYGNLADIIKEKLLQDFPDLFEAPGDSEDSKNSIKLSKIREIINKRKIAVIDLPPNALEKLQQSFSIFPIVLFFKADNKQIIKEIRNNHKSQNTTKLIRTKSTRKQLDESVKLERSIGHLISAVVNLSESQWYRRLKDTIDREQNKLIYVPSQKMEENRPSSSSSEYIFQKTVDSNRHSYASSPDEDKNTSDFESETMRTRPDGANNDENRENTQLPNYCAPPPYSVHIHDPLQTTTPIYPSASSSKTYKTPLPLKPKSMPTVLAHTPPESPTVTKPPRRCGPSVDRTKKPRSNNQTPIYFHTTEQNDSNNMYQSHNNCPSSYNTSSGDIYDRSASTLRKSDLDNYADRDRSFGSNGNYTSSNGTLADHRTMSNNGNYSDMVHGSNGNFPDRSLNSNGQDRSINANVAPYPDRVVNANSTYPDRSITAHNYPDRSHNGSYQDRSQNINYAERSKTSSYTDRTQQNGNYPDTPNSKNHSYSSERSQANPETNYDLPKPSANSTPIKSRPLESHSTEHIDQRKTDNYLSSMSYDMNEGSSKRDVLQPDDGTYKSPYRLLPKTFKPIPPPKPLKMTKPVPEGNGKQGYYLNVPQRTEFNSRDSAFELYRKPDNINNNSGVVGDGERKVVELEKGVFTSAGGVLKPPRDSKYFGIEVIIPRNAIPLHTKQEIFFKVSDQKQNINGDAMLSPMMELGPEGLVFQVPIELRIPSYLIQKEHEAKVYVSNQDNKTNNWMKVDISNYDLCKEESNGGGGMVSISIHHL